MILWFKALDAQGEITHIASLVLEKFYGKLLAKAEILGLSRISMEVHKSLPLSITITSNEHFGDSVPGGRIENRREPVWIKPSALRARR